MKWIDNCLKTIEEDNVDLQVVVVDNNSSDNTLNYIKDSFPKTIILPQKINLGFSGANNIGYEYAKTVGADRLRSLAHQDAAGVRHLCGRPAAVLGQARQAGRHSCTVIF